jgi:plastocyanin
MKTSSRLALGAALALLSAAPAVQAAAPQPVVVPIKSFAFSMSVTVPVGGAVTWKNLDGEPHTVVSTEGLFRSAALDQGDSFTFRFAKPGTYRYICSIHPNMRAVVVVK